ncbi:PA2169 family four-helix-bundle protein [Pedobacter cryotolerans]|uniref:PA2169 family four-helix-bundle protein n=1 Tax=Pedobacter cryotolerans TaxID=2571270 RepID=A0A4U1C1Z1_9SPHI|nr:PA2169 family four-helix-bundle protein [Pedobacter cryotolerans]TKB97110.1 PA2169 family four-helix-bundle protein [Pedobacter cryotolerans]
MMKSNAQIITDLKDLVQIVNDGKEGFKVAAEATNDQFLKDLFMQKITERNIYEDELKFQILRLGEIAENEKGGLIGILHRTWLEIKDALKARDDAAILAAVKISEQAALVKYDYYLAESEEVEDYFSILLRQRAGVLNTLKEVEELHQQFTN